MNDIAVRCHQLDKVFNQGELSVHALSDVSIEIGTGEFVCLSGPSGSGKTTLLNMMGGLDQPTAGEITVAGQRLDTMSSLQLADLRLHHIGFVFQSYNLIPVLSALENVEFVMQLQGLDEKQRRARAMEVLEQVGLSGLENRRPAELSGGQQQRVAVARAIVSKPELVLADEPAANLDSANSDNLMQLMRDLNQGSNITFIISSHDEGVMKFARRLVKLHDGRIVSDETFDD